MLDYWRFTPRGLRTLLERGGLEVEPSAPGATAQCVVGNFTAGPRTGAGTRCATSPTSRSRSGPSRGAAKSTRPSSTPCYGSRHRRSSGASATARRRRRARSCASVRARSTTLADANRARATPRGSGASCQLRHQAGAATGRAEAGASALSRARLRALPRSTRTGLPEVRRRRADARAAPRGDPPRRLPAVRGLLDREQALRSRPRSSAPSRRAGRSEAAPVRSEGLLRGVRSRPRGRPLRAAQVGHRRRALGGRLAEADVRDASTRSSAAACAT